MKMAGPPHAHKNMKSNSMAVCVYDDYSLHVLCQLHMYGTGAFYGNDDTTDDVADDEVEEGVARLSIFFFCRVISFLSLSLSLFLLLLFMQRVSRRRERARASDRLFLPVLFFADSAFMRKASARHNCELWPIHRWNEIVINPLYGYIGNVCTPTYHSAGERRAKDVHFNGPSIRFDVYVLHKHITTIHCSCTSTQIT